MPNTREKLIELLKQMCKREREHGGVTWHDVADHLIANGVTIQQWIPVTERLPEKNGNYLGWTGSTFMVGYYKGNAVWWIWSKDIEGVDLFSHWMPLPEPPKGE